jgi:prepilin-type N-terminal cleavage/methylation domain-containing protein
MNTSAPHPVSDRRGFSLVELIVAITVLSVALVGLSGALILTYRNVHSGRVDINAWAAAQTQAETLLADGHQNVSSGSDVVQGFPMRWTVSGTDTKKVLLEVDWPNRGGTLVTDTIVLYIPQPSV